MDKVFSWGQAQDWFATHSEPAKPTGITCVKLSEDGTTHQGHAVCETLDDARFLEKRFPDKYKGFAAKTEKFLRDHKAMVKQPEFDDQSPEYQTWLQQNQPKLSRAEIRVIRCAGLRRYYLKPFSAQQEKKFFSAFEELWEKVVKGRGPDDPFWRNGVSSKMQEW